MKPDKDTKYYNITCSCGAHVMCIQFSRFSYPELFFAFLTIDGMKKDKSFFSRIKDFQTLSEALSEGLDKGLEVFSK